MFLQKQILKLRRFMHLHASVFLVLLLVATGVFSYTRAGMQEHARVSAATSSNLNFQARLYTASGSTVPDGYYNIQFNLYSVSSGGSTLWTETRDFAGTDDRVRIVNGYFSVNLGSVNSLPSINWDQDLWLGMTVQGSGTCTFGTNCTPADSEMTPRVKLTAVPFAQAAKNVYSGNTSTASTNSDNVSIATGNATGATSNSGNITLDVGTATQTAGTISVGTANTSGVTIGRTGVITSIEGTLRANGAQFTNNASTLNTANSLGNFATGGSIGSAATTVDVDTAFAIAQTTAGQTLSLPSPTDTTAGRVAYVLNTGSASFTMHGVTIPAGYGQIYVWNGSNWILGASGGGAAITLQSAYDGGNTISTTDARNFSLTLSDTSTDANMIVNIASGSTGQFKIQNNGTDVFAIGSAGQLALSVQGNTGGLVIGGDANLYRSAADFLRTDDSLYVQGNITSPGAGAGSEKFGLGATASGLAALAIGQGASASAQQSIAIGQSASATGYFNVVIGNAATGAENTVAIGSGVVGGSSNIVIGQNASSTNGGDIVIGSAATASAQNTIAIGNSATGGGYSSVALGDNSSTAGGAHSIAIGHYATTTAASQLVIGSTWVNGGAITSGYIGNGVQSTAPASFVLNASGGSGTDIAGASFTLAGGRGTGTGAGGNLNFQIATPAGSTGSSLNSLSTVFSLSGTNGAALHKNTANSTTAFAIQNAASTSIFNADTSNSIISMQNLVRITGTNSVAALGSQVLANNSWTGNTDGWNPLGTGWFHGSGAVHKTAGTASDLTYTNNDIAAATYMVTFPITNWTGGCLTPEIAGVAGTAVCGNGTHTQFITSTVTGTFKLKADSSFAGTVDEVSAIPVTNFSSAVLEVRNSNGTVGLEVRAGGAGLKNSIIGVDSGRLITTGASNTSLGYQSLYLNTTGNYNNAIGESALINNISGSGNVANGYRALYGNATGSNNIGIGYQAGYTSSAGNANSSGSNNTFIGYNSGPGTSTQLQNSTAIGTYAVVSQDNSFVLGCINGTNGCTAATKIGIGTATPSALLHVNALAAGTDTLFKITDNTATARDVVTIADGGAATFRNQTDSSAAFQVQNAAGTNVLNIDTTNSITSLRGMNSEATLGAEKVTNGTFTGNATGWTLGTGWAYNSNNVTKTAGTASDLEQNVSAVNGETYQVVFTISGWTAGCLAPEIGGVAGSPICANSTAQTQVIKATGTGNLKLQANASFAGTVDNVSVMKVTTSNVVLEVRNSDDTVGLEVRSGGSGSDSTFIGNRAGQSNTTGYANTAFGVDSLLSNTTGNYNTALGTWSLQANTTGSGNTAIGEESLYSNTTGDNNTAIGGIALLFNTTGSGNAALGDSVLYSNTTGSFNTANGMYALYSNTTGQNNVAFGYQAGYTSAGGNANTTGSNNTFIGYNSGPGSSTQLQNATAIGTYAVVSQDNSLVLGCINGVNGCTAATRVGIGIANPTNDLTVNGYTGIYVTSDFASSVANPGSIAASGPVLNARGLGYATDSTVLSAAYQTTAGIGLAANRASPLLALNNAGGYSILVEAGYVGLQDSAPSTLLSLGGTGSANGITLGDDAANSVNIYRNADNELKTDDALTVAGLLTGQAGATIAGAAISLNDSSNFNTSINTGTSTGTISLGNSATTGFTLESGTNAVSLFNGATAHTINLATGAAAQTVTIGSTNTTSATTLQAGSGNLNLNTAIAQFTEDAAARTLTVQTRTSNVAGTGLTISAGTAGSGASALTGGTLTLQGGAAGGTGNANGGNVLLQGGTGVGTGVMGMVTLAPTAFSAATTQSFGANGTITQANVDSYSTIVISSSVLGPITVTVPNPTNNVVGRILYVTTTGSNNIILSTPGGTPSFTMTPNSSATFIWNGTVWTNAGVDGGSNSYIQNQSSQDQSANFRISGTGRANTSFISPIFKSLDSSGGGNSDNVIFQSGDQTNGTGTSGSVTIKSGEATGGNRSSGNISVDVGTPSGTGTPGTISIGATNTRSITVGNTTTTTALTLQAGSGNINLNASQAQFSEVTGTRTLTVQTRTTNVAGTNLTVSGGTAGSGGSAFTGGTLTLQGGNAAGTGNANGANVILRGGTGVGTGVSGIVEIDTPVFTASSTQTFGSNGSISQAIVDSNSTIPVNATAASLTITLPAPTNTTVGRIIYITSVSGSNSFTIAPSGGTNFVMNANMSGTFIWNGAGWTNAGVDGGSASYIQNQNSVDQTANFRISGTGQANTGLLSPNLEQASAGTLSVGTTANTTGISIGTGAATGNVAIGNSSNAANTVTIEAGTGASAIQIGNGATAHGIQIGTGAAVQTIVIGSTNSTSSLTLQAGTGNLDIGNDAVAKTTTINIGANNTGADLIALGSSHASSTLTLEGGTGATAIQIGNGATAHGIQIGTNATGDNDIVIGGTNSGSTLTLQAGTAAAAIQIGNNAAATGIQIGNANADKDIIIGNSQNSGSTVIIEGGTGASAIQIGNGATAHGIQIGSNATGDNDILIGGNNSGSTLILDGGTAANAIQIGNSATAHGIQIGTGAAVQTIVIGSTNTTSATSIQGGVSGAINIGSVGSSTLASTTNIANTSDATGTQTVNIGSVAKAANATFLQGGTTGGINIGSVGSSTTGSTIHIADTSNGTGTQSITIGSSANAANALILEAGNTGTIAIGNGATAHTIAIGTGAAAQAVTIGSTNTTSATTIQAGSGNINFNSATAQFTESASTRTFTAQTRTTNAAGTAITISAGAAGSGASAFSGGALTLQGGAAAGTGNANGGAVTITGGASVGTGTQGLINLSTTAFSSASVQTFGSPGVTSITAGNVDLYSSLPVTASTTSVIVSVPDPAQTAIGRVLYVAARSGSNDFTLRLNAARTPIDIAMKANSTATLIWNGTDWTAAGASSSTDLQSAYNNTLTSAGGAEIVLNPSGGAADGFTVRNNATTPITGGILEVQSSIGTNLFSVNNFGTELAANGGSETSSTWTTNWTTVGSATVARSTTAGEFVTGLAGARITTTAAVNDGIRNNLSGNPALSTTYQVSFAAKSNTNGTPIDVQYSPDGGSTLRPCSAYSSQTLSNTVWTKITCTITTDATAVTNADLLIRKTNSTTPIIYIDNLSFMRNDSTTQPSNVQIGGGINGGPITLFTLDRSTAPPVANGDTTYLGSMYYDTTTGRIQCYESDGWGACGSAPDNIITLTPEYTGAVLNGTGIGTLTADFCANQAGVLQVNHTTLCTTTGEARNFYRWTSPQASTQSYNMYVTYKLPNTFKEFADANTIKLTALSTDNTKAIAQLQVLKKDVSSGTVVSCGSATTINNADDSWQQTAFAGDETACGFEGGDYIIFKITVTAEDAESIYVENLDFTYTNK